jgi:hypothetical protein
MKRFIKMLAVTCVAALVLAAIAAAGASAATFTASSTGSLTGTSTGNWVLKSGNWTVVCTHLHTHGTIVSTAAASQDVDETYSKCTLSGFPASVSVAEYEQYAGGGVDIENTITISVPFLGCSATVKSQTGLASATYTNKSGKLEQHRAISGIVSSGSGSCAGSSNGTLTSSVLFERVSGGTLSWDA